MPKPSETFKKRLNELLEASGWSQAELGRRIKTAAPAINRWITGAVTPGIDTIQDIATAFGVEIGDLLSDVETKTAPPHTLQDCLAVVSKAALGKPEQVQIPNELGPIDEEIKSLLASLNEGKRTHAIAFLRGLAGLPPVVTRSKKAE